MQEEKLVPGNVPQLQVIMADFTQLLPLFASQQRARDHFLGRLASFDQGEEQQFAFKKNTQLVALLNVSLEKGRLKVCDFLLRSQVLRERLSLGFWVRQLEKKAKLLGANELEIEILPLNKRLEEQLLAQGYHLEVTSESWLFKKQLSYHTGVVLAGGGARGAYQIGAWRALRELEIPYEIITGTSVGALNGALMLQDDFSQGEQMWHEIETGKILSYPQVGAEAAFSVKQTLKEMQLLAQSALHNQGVSTAPLAELIDRLLDEEKMRQAPQNLWLCTTEAPSMKEVVISMKEAAPGTFNQWLLASSSFFPAMAAAKIGPHYYVDGGYRNNIPVDVALAQGATELIVIDVKGPGLTKGTKVPLSVPLVTVSSPWSLGTVLLFDGARSSWNIELGYLETLKAFGRYRGYWYTLKGDFNQQAFSHEVASLLAEFVAGLTSAERALFQDSSNFAYLRDKISPYYGERLTPGGVYVFILERLAKYLDVKPTQLYSLSGFHAAIAAQLGQHTSRPKEEPMLWSLAEWLKRYVGGLPLPTERQQIAYVSKALAANRHDPLLLNVAKISPVNYLVAALLLQFQNECV